MPTTAAPAAPSTAELTAFQTRYGLDCTLPAAHWALMAARLYYTPGGVLDIPEQAITAVARAMTYGYDGMSTAGRLHADRVAHAALLAADHAAATERYALRELLRETYA